MSEGVASTYTCALPTWNAGTSVGKNFRTTFPSHSTFVLIFPVTYMRPSELLVECLPRQRSEMGRSSCTKHATVEPASIGCAVSALCKKCKDEVSGERSGVPQNRTKQSRLLADYHSLPRPLRIKLETLAQRAEVLWTRLTCSVDLASWQKQQIIWVCVNSCSTQMLVPGMTRDTAHRSHWNSTGRLHWKMCRRNDFTFTTTHFVLSQSYLR